VEQLEHKVRGYEVAVDELRENEFKHSDSFKSDEAEQLRRDLKRANNRLSEDKAELDLLRKQVEGKAEFKDFNKHIDNLKKRAAEREDELTKHGAYVLGLKQQSDKELAAALQENKKLREDFDKTLSKEKLAELIKD